MSFQNYYNAFCIQKKFFLSQLMRNNKKLPVGRCSTSFSFHMCLCVIFLTLTHKRMFVQRRETIPFRIVVIQSSYLLSLHRIPTRERNIRYFGWTYLIQKQWIPNWSLVSTEFYIMNVNIDLDSFVTRDICCVREKWNKFLNVFFFALEVEMNKEI